MAHYRCYFLNDAGSIRSFETFECATDQEAVDVARLMFAQRSHFRGFEVWLRDRQVYVEQAAPPKEDKDGAR